MQFRTRRSEQRHHHRLGQFILLTAVTAGVALTAAATTLLPANQMAMRNLFLALAVFLSVTTDRILRRALGFDAQKASLQYLKPASDRSENS